MRTRSVSSDRLIEALWEGEPPGTAHKALQVYVSQLRKLLGKERLQTKAPGYLLRVEEGELDLERFQRCTRRAGMPRRFRFGGGRRWRTSHISASHDRRSPASKSCGLPVSRIGSRLTWRLAVMRTLVGELDALVKEHPLRQRLRAQLMLALYRSGRDAEALDAYQDARKALVEELGIEPRRELRELQQAILNQDPSTRTSSQTDCSERDRTRGGIRRSRAPSSKAVGRPRRRLCRPRAAVPLVGEPGIGKSRLADELIAERGREGREVLDRTLLGGGGAPAYWPWVQSLRAYVERDRGRKIVRSQLGAGASDLAQLLPELRELFPDLPEPPDLEPESARFRLFEAASSFLRSAAKTRPLVLVLDDLHAADEPSLLLLQFLARELGRKPVACRRGLPQRRPDPDGSAE